MIPLVQSFVPSQRPDRLMEQVSVESHWTSGLPSFRIIGMAKHEVVESRERIRVALASAGVRLPVGHVTVSLGPADVVKSGSGLDLPIAASLISLVEDRPVPEARRTHVFGELGLNGRLHETRGALAAAARLLESEDPVSRLVVSAKDAHAIGQSTGLEVIGIDHLSELFDALDQVGGFPKIAEQSESACETDRESDLAAVRLSAEDARVLACAALGAHQVSVHAPWSSQVGEILRAFAWIQPPMTQVQRLRVQGLAQLSRVEAPRGRPWLTVHGRTSAASLWSASGIGLVDRTRHGSIAVERCTDVRASVLDGIRKAYRQEVLDLSLIVHVPPCPCGRGVVPDAFGQECVCTSQSKRRHRASTGQGLVSDAALAIPARPGTISALDMRSLVTAGHALAVERCGHSRQAHVPPAVRSNWDVSRAVRGRAARVPTGIGDAVGSVMWSLADLDQRPPEPSHVEEAEHLVISAAASRTGDDHEWM